MVKNTDLQKTLFKSNKCTKIILVAKEKYINGGLSKKLGNLEATPKTYWEILNRFMISNFSKKADLFSKFFYITMYAVIKHKYFAISYHQNG